MGMREHHPIPSSHESALLDSSKRHEIPCECNSRMKPGKAPNVDREPECGLPLVFLNNRGMTELSCAKAFQEIIT